MTTAFVGAPKRVEMVVLSNSFRKLSSMTRISAFPCIQMPPMAVLLRFSCLGKHFVCHIPKDCSTISPKPSLRERERKTVTKNPLKFNTFGPNCNFTSRIFQSFYSGDTKNTQVKYFLRLQSFSRKRTKIWKFLN